MNIFNHNRFNLNSGTKGLFDISYEFQSLNFLARRLLKFDKE